MYIGLEDPIRQVRNKEEENDFSSLKEMKKMKILKTEDDTGTGLLFRKKLKGRYASGLIVIDGRKLPGNCFAAAGEIGHDAQVFVLEKTGRSLIDAGNGSTSCRELLPMRKADDGDFLYGAGKASVGKNIWWPA